MNICITPYNNVNNPSFYGHGGCERIFKDGRFDYVTTETRFLRDYKTIKQAINYINRTFKDVKEKKIVVGACSTGEDVYSLKMLSDDSVSILGFDLGEETIKKAKSGIFELYKPHDKDALKYTTFAELKAYKDTFLLEDFENLSPEQANLKRRFVNLFENIDSKNKIIYKLTEALRKCLDITYVEFDRKLFRVKHNDNSCTFKNGDILKLDEIVDLDSKNLLFSFKNALYHLVTEDKHFARVPLSAEKSKPILDKIFKNINNTLAKKGLFIMGEEEDLQKSDVFLISKSLTDNGFVPIRTNTKYPNIWVKVKNAE